MKEGKQECNNNDETGCTATVVAEIRYAGVDRAAGYKRILT
jgi:hypothetical protein